MTGTRFIAAAAPAPTSDRDDWRASADCANHIDRDWLFFPVGEREQVDALAETKRICGACPVQADCLQYALDHPELSGIWAATTADERVNMRRNRAKRQRRLNEREATA